MLEIIHNAIYDKLLEIASAALPNLEGRIVFSHEQSMDYRLCVERFKQECCDTTHGDDVVSQGSSRDVLPFIAITKNPPQRQPEWFPGGKALVNKNLRPGTPDYGKYTAAKFAVCYIEYPIRYYFGSEFDYNRIIEYYFLMFPESRLFLSVPIYFCDNKCVKADIYFTEFEEIQKIDAGTFDTNKLYTLMHTWRVETHIVGMLSEGPLVLRPLVDFRAYKQVSEFQDDPPEYAEEIDYSKTFPEKDT